MVGSGVIFCMARSQGAMEAPTQYILWPLRISGYHIVTLDWMSELENSSSYTACDQRIVGQAAGQGSSKCGKESVSTLQHIWAPSYLHTRSFPIQTGRDSVDFFQSCRTVLPTTLSVRIPYLLQCGASTCHLHVSHLCGVYFAYLGLQVNLV